MANSTQRKSRATSYFPVKIPIYSLSGGVGRQIPSKRLPTEAEVVTNFFCTTESSLDKRNGTRFLGNLFSPETDQDLKYHWRAIDNQTAYLFIFQQNASVTGTRLKVFKITSASVVTEESVDPLIEDEIIDYITHEQGDLKFVNIGASVLVLNPEVYAGFTSIEGDFLRDLDGEATATEDIKGANIQYLTASSVHRDLEAEVWVESQDYTWGQKVIDPQDPVFDPADNPESNPWGEWRGLEWDEGVTSYPGGHLTLDFNTSVLSLNDDNGKISSYVTDTKNGCQLTLTAVDPDNDTSVTKNFLWVNPTHPDESASYPTGTVFPWTSGNKQKRAETLCVNVFFDWVQATTTVEFSAEIIAEGETITLIDGFGLSKTYTAAIGENLDNNEFTMTGISASTKAQSLADCIEHSAGHNGTIHVERSGTTLTLTQDVHGIDGNTTVTSTLTGVTTSDFSGGAMGNDYTEDEIGNGYADARELSLAITGDDDLNLLFSVKANKESFSEDAKTYPGRLLIRSNNGGKDSNTKIWINTASVTEDSEVLDYNLNSYCSTTIPSTFTEGVEEGTESINDAFNPTWDRSKSGEEDFWDKDGAWNTDNIKTDVLYGIWEVKSYLPAEELPGPTNELLSDDIDPKGSTLPPHADLRRWKRVENSTEDLNKSGDTVNIESSWFIPVEEYVYPTSTASHLGQSVTRLSDLKFPPDEGELTAYNGEDNVTQSLEALYDLDEDSPSYNRSGTGKIYYLSQAYLDKTPGWYRVVSVDEAPYLKKVRAPGKRAVIDQKRMPMMLYYDSDNSRWSLRMVDWEHRLSGDEETNRGPGIFFDPSTGKAQETKINTMAFYRDRLFLANSDTIISSRSGAWDNFFIADSDSISNSDPLDLMVSSNNYTPIKNLIPFRDILFVGTEGNTQYELMGSQNVVSPLTAEFAPTAFYPMITEVDPITLNNNLFFFSKKKLYIYYGQKAAVIEKAFELSKHVPGYLPDSIQSAASSGHASMIFALEQDTTPSSSEESTVFVYRNQIANEKVVQNAFFKWVFSNTENYSTRFIDTWNKHLYLVSLEYEGSTPHLVLSRLFLDIDNDNIPRLDHRRNDVDGYTLSYSESTDLTTITTDHGLPYIDTLVFDDGEVLTVEKSGDDGTTYTVSGNYENRTNLAYSGLSYTSTVELSTAYLRDEGNNIHPGTLNLRYCVIQTYNSKQFDVDIDIHNRSKVTHSFNQEIADTREDHDWIGSSTITGRVKEHQVRVPVLGFNQDVRITISSSNPHPLNIASLQYSGKFKGTTRFHNS